MAALTILRAYIVAGRPHQALRPWGGFDEWSATIRAPLVWLGMADPCKTRQHVIEDDPDREQAAAVLSAWWAAFEDKPVQIAQLLERLPSSAQLASALQSVAADKKDASQIDPRRVGWWCRQWRDRVVGGLRLQRAGDYGDRATWQVSAVSTVNTVRIPSTEADGEGSGSIEGSSRPENDRTDRSERKEDGSATGTLFGEGALVI